MLGLCLEWPRNWQLLNKGSAPSVSEWVRVYLVKCTVSCYCFSEHDRRQGEMTTLWHLTMLYIKYLATSTSLLFTTNSAIYSGPIIKQHVLAPRSITKPLVYNNFWLASGPKSFYIALSRTAGLVFISSISQFIILHTYSRRPMGSDLEMILKVVAVI
jgi:hypothetical protein